MTIIKADDIDACGGDQMLGVFMHELFAWADTTKAELTKIDGTQWIGCSMSRWITKRQPWGKKVKVSEHQFKRMLARGRKFGVLKTRQWPSRFETGNDGQWKTVLHVRPADGYDQRRQNARLARCERATDALPKHGWCTAGALPMHHSDHNSELGTQNLGLGTGALANASERPDLSESMTSAPREEPSALKSPPTPHARIAQIDAGSVTPKDMYSVWAEGCRKHHKFEPLPMTGKSAGQFKSVIAAFHHVGVHPLEGLAAVVKAWFDFGYAAESKAGATSAPSNPNLDFLVAHREIAANLAPKLIETGKRDAERKAPPASPAKPKPLSWAEKHRAHAVRGLEREIADTRKRLDTVRDYQEHADEGEDWSKGIAYWSDQLAALNAKLAALENPLPEGVPADDDQAMVEAPAPLAQPVSKTPKIEEETGAEIIPLFPPKAA